MFLKGFATIVLSIIVLMNITGCVLLTDYQNMKQRAETAEKINQDIRNAADKLETDYERLKAKLSALEGSGADRAELLQQIAQLKAKLRDLLAGGVAPIPEIPSIPGIERSSATGALLMKNKFLFSLGSWQLKESAKATLLKLAEYLKKTYPNHIFYIDGFTDRVPISKTKKFNPDNWFLGYRRAHAVMCFLRDKGGIPQKQFVTDSFGWLREIEPNKIKSEKNRRVEIRIRSEFPKSMIEGTKGG